MSWGRQFQVFGADMRKAFSSNFSNLFKHVLQCTLLSKIWLALFCIAAMPAAATVLKRHKQVMFDVQIRCTLRLSATCYSCVGSSRTSVRRRLRIAAAGCIISVKCRWPTASTRWRAAVNRPQQRIVAPTLPVSSQIGLTHKMSR